MKKLLVTVIGATAAIGAFAGYPLQFDTFGDGAKSTNELNAVHGNYWYANPEATDNAYTIEALTSAGTLDGGCPLPTGSTPNKALSIKTKFTNPLSANFVDGGAATNINDGLFFDSLVKFTVCDTAPETDSYDNAKIVMWLQEDEVGENQTETNLWVRAGYLSADGTTITRVCTNYKTGFGINGTFADKWHRVTIKAIADITEDGDNVEVPGFAIYIDANQNQPTPSVTCGAAKWDGTFGFTLTEDAAFLNLSGAVFPSMVQSGANKQTLEAVAFDGTGSISDLVFTDQAPAFADDFVEPKASITIGNLTTQYNTLEDAITAVNDVGSGDVTLALMKDMTLSDTLAFASDANVIFDFAGFVLTNNGNTPAISNNGNLVITNSTGNGGVVCTSTGAAVVSGDAAGQTDIMAGFFNGSIVEDGLDVLLVYGGSFKTNTAALAPGKVYRLNALTGLYDVDNFVPVAQIEGGAQYETLKDAVDAATAGQTVTVLADCTVDESISFTKNITVSNDYTIAANVNYALCIGATVTFEGSGTIERAVGITGSPLCVGANEATRGTITVGTAGTLIFNGGTVSGGSGGNLIKLENGTVTMNGGLLTGGQRGIKADADKGSYTSAIVINGGTITNNSECAVNASAESASGTATITINGGVIAGAITYGKTTGTHSITIPGSSTAKFDRDQTTYCATDYKTVLSDGWYVVTAKEYYTAVSLNKATTSIETNLTETLIATFTPASAADDTYTWASSAPAVATVDQNGVVTAIAEGTATITVTATHDSSVTASCTVTVTATPVGPAPLDPSGDVEETTVTAASSEAAIQAVTINPPAESGAQAGDYKSLFTYDAQPAGDGQYTVTITGIQESVKQDVATDAAEILDGTSDTVTVPAGLYYKITTMEDLDGTNAQSVDGLSTGEGVEVTKPASTTQGFIKVEMGTKAFN